jgi:chromosomal replication initiation ATPase DnaA
MNTKSTQNFGKIVEMAAEYYGLSVSDLKSDSRKQEITVARQLLMLIAKKYYGWTLEKV